MWKVGAATQADIDATRSVGVGRAPCTPPANGGPNVETAPGRMEIGIGHHREPGMEVVALDRAAAPDRMLDVTLGDHDLTEGDRVCILLPGLGATPVNELYLLYDLVEIRLAGRRITLQRAFVGDDFPSPEVMGADLARLIDTEAVSPGLIVPKEE